MFDSITKGECKIVGYAGEHDEGGAVIKCGDIHVCSTSYARKDKWDEYHDNAKFISFAFNLQQKYDIGLLSVAVDQLQKILDYWDSGNFTRDPLMWSNTREVIKAIKQNK